MKKAIATLAALAFTGCSSVDTLEQKTTQHIPDYVMQEVNSDYAQAFSKAWGIYRNIIHINDNLDQRNAYKNAIDPFEEFLKLREGDAKDYHALATCYMMTGQFDNAKRSIDIAIKKDPSQEGYKTTLDLINRQQIEKKILEKKKDVINF